MSVRAQVLNLLQDIQASFDLTYLFIAHDLSVVRYMCHNIAVMYLGRIVEICETQELFENPLHPYTKALLDAVPIPDPTKIRERVPLSGSIPSPMNLPTGCRFPHAVPVRDGRLLDGGSRPAGGVKGTLRRLSSLRREEMSRLIVGCRSTLPIRPLS